MSTLLLEHAPCPGCGAALAVRTGHATVSCAACGLGAAIIARDPAVPRYRVPAAIDLRSAQALVRHALRHDRVARRATTRARITRTRLYEAPLWELEAIMASADRPLCDWYRSGPATALSHWGLEHINLRQRRLDHGALLEPHQIEPTGPLPLPVSAELAAPRPVSGELCALHRRLVYYPVWHVSLVLDDHPYQFTVDGVTGDILSGRAPEEPGVGLVLSLMGVSLLGVVLGKLVSEVLVNYPPTSAGVLTVLAALLGLPALLLLPPALVLLGVLWAELRYPGEVVFSPRGGHVERPLVPHPQGGRP